MELWDLSGANNSTLLHNVSLLDDAAQYQSCVTESVGSAALKDTTLNIATVAYYNGTTPGSMACFVCDGHELNTTINERVCQTDATWSGSPVTCGMYSDYQIFIHATTKIYRELSRDVTDTQYT